MNEYSRRSETWVRNKYLGANPDPGSVKFGTDCAAYESGAWAEIHVSWTERGGRRGVCKTLAEAWDYDLTQLIRELLEIDIS